MREAILVKATAKLALIFLLLSVSALGWSQTQTFTNVAVTGTESVGKWNNIRIVDGVKFQTIAAAIADLPSGVGGVVYSDLPETFTANPFDPNRPVKLVLGMGTWSTDVPLTLTSNSQIVGSGRGEGNQGTVIMAAGAFPTNSAVISLGETVPAGPFGGQTFGERLEGVRVDCNNIPGSTGMYNNTAGELSGPYHVAVSGCMAVGIDYEGTYSQNAGPISDVVIAPSLSAPMTFVGIKVNGVTAFRGIRGATISNAGIPNTQVVAIEISGVPGGNIADVHCEYLGTCVMVSSNSEVNVSNIDGYQVTNLVHLDSTSKNVNLWNLHGFSGTYSIVDDVFGYTNTLGQIGFYSIGDGGTRISSINTLPAQFNSGVQLGGSSATWTTGKGVPSGACTKGSVFTRTDGVAGATLYVCETGAGWASK